MAMHKVTLLPKCQVVEVDGDKPLLTELRRLNVYIKSSCGGVASCSDCIVKVMNGAENLNAPSFEETRLLGNVFHLTKERLSCQTKIRGDIEIDISAHDLSSDQNKLKKKSNQFRVGGGTKLRKSHSSSAPKQSENREGRGAEGQGERPDSPWFKHWEKKDQKPELKKSGGKKRPKAFNSDFEE